MPIFSHRVPAPLRAGNYRRYRPYIREDFFGSCAYCLLPEFLVGGERAFELDHHRPVHQFPALECTYENIYYACRCCNSTKHGKWPSVEQEAQGLRFVDYCREDFSAHFRDEEGWWAAITPSGAYSEEKLRLNTKHLIRIRRLLLQLLTDFGAPPVDWDMPTGPQLGPLVDALDG